MLVEKGHTVVLLNNDQSVGTLDELPHAHWLGTSQIQDAQATIRTLSGAIWDLLIVDHYALDVRWESLLRQSVKKIMIIDDLADRQHDCDVLLDQNLNKDVDFRYKGLVPSHCQLLQGPHYALLREEFSKIHKRVNPRAGGIKRILVFLGGVDIDNFTNRILETFNEIGIKEIGVDVVIGQQHPFREQIESVCSEYGFVCHVQTDRMAELMAAADLAIGAGGSASWERCCLGLPAVLVSLASNQVGIAKELDVLGACIYLGSDKVVSMEMIREAIMDLLDHPAQLAALSEKSYSLVDGHGVNRVLQTLWC
jgi:UDP-2,4-diacetamido-2,4,6-trideoxy-beta-L-altropyranose hydrolase